MEFALETVSRRGEVVRLGPQHVSGGRIRIERIHGAGPALVIVAMAHDDSAIAATVSLQRAQVSTRWQRNPVAGPAL
jgi:hypothetical protein